MKRFWLLDLSWSLYRSYYTFGFMTADVNGFEKPTGHIYGTLSSIQEILSQYPNDIIVLCEDGKPKGKALNSEYKAGRTQLAYNIHSDELLVEEIACLHPNVYVAGNREAEADEVMFALSRFNIERGDNTVVYSGDDDMLQSLHPMVSIYRGKDKKEEKWITYESYDTDEHLQTKFRGCPVEYLPVYRSLVGDKSDNLRGIDRFPRDLAVYIARSGWKPIGPEAYENLCVIYNSSPLAKASYTKYIRELGEDLPRIRNNYEIMKLNMIPVSVYRPQLSEEHESVYRQLLLRKWGGFIERSVR